MIVSDHGFSHYKYIININSYLYNRGYAKISIKEGLKEFWEHMEPEEKTTITVENKLLLKMANLPVLNKLARRMKHLYEKVAGKQVSIKEYNVDYKNSKAFFLSTYSHGIIINDKRIDKQLVTDLMSLNGIKSVYYSKTLFEGPYIHRGPDLFVEPDFDNGYTLGKNKVSKIVIRRKDNNNHHPLGIFIFYNDDATDVHKKENIIIPNYSIANIILGLIGLKISSIADNPNLLKELLGTKNIRYENYVAKWKLLKKAYAMKKALPKG